MSDISRAWLLDPIPADGGSDDLAESVVVALGTDRRALPDDVLPDPRDDDRRGWWGDTDAARIWGGWPVGARFWLLRRASITGPAAKGGSTLARVNEYANEALRPFKDAGVCSRISVASERVGLGQIRVNIVLYRGPNSEVALSYQYLWNEVRK